MSVGGVCGFITTNAGASFEGITIGNLSVAGSCVVGGLLGYSGLNSATERIVVKDCNAESISVRMKSSSDETSADAPRNSIGTLVGKCFQGRVVLAGNETNGSEVNIKSYIIDNSPSDLYITAGGLVGFSGHGCESSNMTLKPYNNASITIGGSGVKYVGGIVGCMQPYSGTVTTGTAQFTNTTIEEINFAGKYVGGLFGGKWDNTDFVPYEIIIDNCEVKGKSSSEKNSITAGSYAGGLIGWGAVKTRNGDDANIEIKDSKVTNYTISCTASSGASGGFIGYCRSKHNSITCYIHDSSIENCVIGGSKNEYAGGAVGKLDEGTANVTYDDKLLGYNIKLDEVTSGSTKNGTWIGVIVDTLTQTTIQFTGLAVYGNRFSNTDNVYSGTANASFVFASYEEEKNTAVSAVSSFNCSWDAQEQAYTGHVDMPKYPYVNVTPQSGMGTGEYISSDGAAVNGRSEPMAREIYDDLSDESNSRRYTTFADSEVVPGHTIGDYFDANSENDRITTFKTLHGIGDSAGFDDFAVVVIANTEVDETTNLINQYIRLVTNTDTDYTKLDESKYRIIVKACEFNGSGFAVNDTPASIEYTPSQSSGGGMIFMPVASRADSLQPQYRFSLIDVQFKDPLDESRIAYHLYVPVYLKKEIEITFNTSVRSGTLSASGVSNPYVPVSTEKWSTELYLDGLETWITQYVRFTYTQLDLQAFLDTGDTAWAHEKKINFVTLKEGNQNAYRLPDGTKLVLVDPNGGSDEAYYADIEDFNSVNGGKDWSLPFEKFKDSGGNAFAYRSIGEILQGNVTIATVDDSSGNYRQLGDGESAENAVTFDGIKYVPAQGGSIRITVNGDVSEDYYIMQYAPKPSNYSGELYWYMISTDDYLYTENGKAKAKVHKGNNEEIGNTRNVAVSDTFTQSDAAFTVEPDNVVISSDNKAITIEAETSIKVNNGALVSLLGGNHPIFHAFRINLNRYTETGVEDKIYGLDGGSITAECTVNGVTRQAECELDEEGHYINIITGNITPELYTYWFGAGQPVTIKTTITLDFDGTMLENEFPRLSANEEDNINRIGVRAEVDSNLAYDKDHLAHTSMTKRLSVVGEAKYFHRVISADVVLYYYSIDELDEQDYFGKMSDNYSRYGVNGFFWPETSDNLPKDPAARKPYMANGETGTGMRINAEASYNVIEIENDIKDAKYLRVTIRLQKKENIVDNENKIIGAKYTDVSELQKYLLGMIEVKCGNQTGYAQVNGTTAVIDIPKPSNPEDWDYVGGIFKLKVGFNVKTGEGFHEYANYKMYLDARMLGGTKDEITVSKSNEQYIVYTNAKVIPTFIYD